jgi:predicted nucleic acid-binding protein
MGAVTFDASVLIGFLEPTDALHDRASQTMVDWLGGGHRRYMSTATYAEILIHPIRDEQDAVVEDFVERAHVTLVPVDRALARRAAELRARFPISLGDAMALATARRTESLLLTFDDQLALADDRT